MQGAIFRRPENIKLAPLWDNPMVLRNKLPLKEASMPILSQRIKVVGDLYDPETGLFIPREKLERKYDVNLSEETYTELHYIIKTARNYLGITDCVKLYHVKPYQPLLIQTLQMVKKGCNVYYSMIRKPKNLKQNLSKRESKWHEELGCSLSVKFWNRCYAWCATIKHENKIKWLQYQINRNCLFTNYKVNKFSAQVSPHCSFCSINNEGEQYFETISHLFYDCNIVLNFWQKLRDWLETLQSPIVFPHSKKAVLFGINDQPYDSVLNFIILCSKYYIWKTRLQSNPPYLNLFKIFLKSKLNDLRGALNWMGKENEFEKWLNIYQTL